MAANPDPVWPGPFQFRSGSVKRGYVYLKVIYKQRYKRHLTTTMQIQKKLKMQRSCIFKQGFQGYATPNKGFQSVFRIRIHWFRIRIQNFRFNINPDPDSRFWWQIFVGLFCPPGSETLILIIKRRKGTQQLLTMRVAGMGYQTLKYAGLSTVHINNLNSCNSMNIL